MRSRESGRFSRWMIAFLLWFGLAFSLGWYYTFTYYGRSGWPMPVPEAIAALLLYYFSVLNISTEGQAIHWLAVFPAAGALWTCALWAMAPRFGLERLAPSRITRRIALASLPLFLAGPPMALLAGNTDTGFSVERMMDVALRHGFVSPPDWLTPVYFGLGALSLALQLFIYWKLFAPRPKIAVYHLGASAILLIVLSCALGSIAAIPLRALLEQ